MTTKGMTTMLGKTALMAIAILALSPALALPQQCVTPQECRDEGGSIKGGRCCGPAPGTFVCVNPRPLCPPPPPPPCGGPGCPPPGPGGGGGIGGSIDPNDKVASEGVTAAHFLSGGESLRYAIFFENLPAATLPAQEVVITDPLDVGDLDLGTVSLGPITFGQTVVTPPPGLSSYITNVDLRPAKNVIVRIEANLDADTGVLSWRFTSLDPATGQLPEEPMDGFLPPNQNSPEGEGSVLFTVRAKADRPTGTEICNAAAIVFDVNPPIATPARCNTLDNTAPQSHVLPLAATQTSATFDVQWSGTDGGSGIESCSIFVSEDGGPFTRFVDTAATAMTFTGQPGRTYAFFSVARDKTGNVEDLHIVADATTETLSDAAAPTASASVSPTPNAAGWNRSEPTVTLTAADEAGGSGVAGIVFSATGAQPIAETTVTGETATITIGTEGVTELSYRARDRAGNLGVAHTLAIRLDRTPPILTFGPQTPPANANGWNNGDVSFAFTAADDLSGVASTTPPGGVLKLTSEGHGLTGAVEVTDVAGNTAVFMSTAVNIDRQGPVVVVSRTPEPNANGWHNGPVTAHFVATDALSGIVAPSSADVALSAEGLAQAASRTFTDRAGNTATGAIGGINIDLKAPEASLQADPATGHLAVFGIDPLSGVPPGPVGFTSVATPHRHEQAQGRHRSNSDCHEDHDHRGRRRQYRIEDLAGNALTLVVAVEHEGSSFKGSLASLEYLDAAGARRRPAPRENELQFERDARRDGTLRTFRQEMEVESRREQDAEARFEARTNQTRIEIQRGGARTRLIRPGLVLLRLETEGGRLRIKF